MTVEMSLSELYEGAGGEETFGSYEHFLESLGELMATLNIIPEIPVLEVENVDGEERVKLNVRIETE